jgi:hypothetical protein
MKKALFLFAASLLSAGVWAQTIVSTQPQNRNVIIEEFTGVNCQYCPDGHRIVNEIIEANPGRVAGINIHQGYYAQNSPYTTVYGDALAEQTGLQGYPAGTVNRHVFSGNSTALGRNSFAQASDVIMDMESPVNVAVVGRIDEANRQVTLHIEVYYTGNSTVTTNYLNIAVLQNNVMGQQTGGSTWYPEMVENGQYRHMHMLRELLTGQWGQAIPATQGTFIDTTIVYNVPQSIGQVEIPDLNDLDFVVFVAEGHQEILTGVKATIITDAPALSSFKVYQTGDCSLTYQPYVTINNSTESAFTNFVFNYDGGTFTSNKVIPSFQMDTINLPLYTIDVTGSAVQQCAVTKTISLTSCETTEGAGFTVNSAAKSVTFAEFNIYTVAGPFMARIGVDAYRSEAGVQFIQQGNCQTLWTENNFGSDISTQGAQRISQLPNATYFNINFSPAEAGLYIFRATDAYGDGWNMTNNSVPSGIWISDGSGNQFVSESWGYSAAPAFSTLDFYLNVTNAGDGNHTVGINDVDGNVAFSIYPNPVTDRLSINCNEAVREISVMDISGRTVMTLSNTNSIDVSGLATGVYMLRVATENGVSVQKFVKE